MKFRTALPCVLLAIFGVYTLIGMLKSNYHKELNLMTDQSINKPQPRIVAPHEGVDSLRIPAIVQFSDEQRIYVSEIVAALMRVMAEVSTLEAEEEKILGVGKFRWPKNPNEPIKTLKSYLGENFRMAGITASFQRDSEDAPWSKAGLTVHPRNFPAGVYSMRLPATLFDDFKLEKVVRENREEERIKMPVVFYFSHKKITNFALKIESRSDVTGVDDSFPPSFHAIIIIRSQK